MPQETKPKRQLVERLKHDLVGAVVLRHEDHFRAGIPDISVTWHKLTTWLEVKHADPYLSGSGIQLHLAGQLADQGFCWFIIYYEDETAKRTLIVHPSEVYRDSWKELSDSSRMAQGFDHKFVVDFLRGQYRDHRAA